MPIDVMPKPVVGKQEKVCVGHEQDYPGAYRWPIYQVRCPECGQMTKEYGDVSVLSEDGHEHLLCTPCGEEVIRMSNPMTDDEAAEFQKLLTEARARARQDA